MNIYIYIYLSICVCVVWGLVVDTMEVEGLPWTVVVEILSRVDDVFDWGRCRTVNKYLLDISPHVHSIRFNCTHQRFLKTRFSSHPITPFKHIVTSSLLQLIHVQSVRLDLEESVQRLFYEEEDGELDDYWLTDIGFVLQWLPHIAESLLYLCITDFWQQSCWRCTNVLSVISVHCKALRSLELRNAWLSVEGMRRMGSLTNLTLQFIRLNDESLAVVNEFFPALETLNLINVGGLKDPCICLPQLRVCHWAVSNTPVSLTLDACKLVQLRLECSCPERLNIRAPMLESLRLCIERPGKLFRAEGMLNLRSVALDSSELRTVMWLISGREFVEKLLVELPILVFDEEGRWDGIRMVNTCVPHFEELGIAFPTLHTLIIGPGAWYALESCLCREGETGRGLEWKLLKKLVLRLLLVRAEATYALMARILGLCPTLSDVEVDMHWDTAPESQTILRSTCQKDFPCLRWKWGTWKKGLNGF